MSVGRAFDDLVALNLAKTERRGKGKYLTFNADGWKLLRLARTLLRNPVWSVKHVRNLPSAAKFKRAGETALSELTDLSAQRRTLTRWRQATGKLLRKPSISLRLMRATWISRWKPGPTILSDYPTRRLSIRCRFTLSSLITEMSGSDGGGKTLGAFDMVVGLEKFREHFAGHENQYAIIGGTACDLLFEAAGSHSGRPETSTWCSASKWLMRPLAIRSRRFSRLVDIRRASEATARRNLSLP